MENKVQGGPDPDKMEIFTPDEELESANERKG